MRRGEITCRYLGMAVESYDETGASYGACACVVRRARHASRPDERTPVQAARSSTTTESWSARSRFPRCRSSSGFARGVPVRAATAGAAHAHRWTQADANGSKYRGAYFGRFDGVWAHGDYCQINSDTGGLVILGRSDGTLNPAGVRFGSAEIYMIGASVSGAARPGRPTRGRSRTLRTAQWISFRRWRTRCASDSAWARTSASCSF